MQSLVLGTAQWGSNYGLTNAGGRLTDAALAELLEAAGGLGLALLDTAPAYGDAEARIGRMAPGLRVQTKVNVAETAVPIRDQVQASCDRMGHSTLWGVLVHDWPAATSASRAVGAGALGRLVSDGLVERVGVSVYEEVDLVDLLTIFPSARVVQVPVNLLDQRLADSELITELRSAGVRIQSRSVFLQGLLLASTPPTAFSDHPDLMRARRGAESLGISSLALALGFIRSHEWIDEVVVAPTSAEELLAIHSAWVEAPTDLDWASFASRDLDLLDPRRWA